MINAHINIDLPPVSKKNSQQIIRINGRPCIIPSKVYKAYEKAAVELIRQQWSDEPIGEPVNVAMVFHMPTRRRVDLVNLQEAALDVLVKAKVLTDDNCSIVTSMDGSAVAYDKDNPRTEIRITGKEESADDEQTAEGVRSGKGHAPGCAAGV